MHMCPLGHPYENAEVISSQSLVDGVFISVKPASAMHHWSSVSQQLLALWATLLPVLPSHKAFPMGGLSFEPSNWSAEHSWGRCTYETWNWCVARSRDGKVVHVGLCFAVSSWHWRGHLLGEGWGNSMEVSCSMGAYVGRTGGFWQVMGKVEFGLWSVQGAEMPYFNLGMGCCSVSNTLCSVFQLYSCRMVMLAATVFCLWGIFHVWTVERMEGILTDTESMHMGVHQGAWMLNSLLFKCTLVQTNLLSNG